MRSDDSEESRCAHNDASNAKEEVDDADGYAFLHLFSLSFIVTIIIIYYYYYYTVLFLSLSLSLFSLIRQDWRLRPVTAKEVSSSQ